MIRENDIITHIIDGEEKTCIRLGRDDFGLPKHLMQGEKQCSYALIDGELVPVYWEGLISIEGNKYLYLKKIDLLPISSIATTEREHALTILREIAYVLTKAPKDFATLETGVFPLWRMYILKQGGVLVLSEDLSNLFATMQEDEERKDQVYNWTKRNTEKGYTVISEFAQLLYYALTSIAPFGDDEIRSHAYNEIPLEFFKAERFNTLSPETLGFINFALHAKSREMRDISGNSTALDNLKWFLSRTQNLTWNVEDVNTNDSEALLEKVKATEEYKAFWARTLKGAKRNRFWRVKGTIIVTSVIAVALALAFLVPYVYSFFEPPYTRLMEREDIIVAFYDAQNSLDIDKLDAALKKTKAPQETEVINLYVTGKTRLANEMFDPVNRADVWVAEGKPAIVQGSYVYGVSNLEIKQVSENVYDATSIWYTPFAYDEDDDKTDNNVYVYSYKITQRFTFAWNDRGWYNIVNIENIYDEYLKAEIVETYKGEEVSSSDRMLAGSLF